MIKFTLFISLILFATNCAIGQNDSVVIKKVNKLLDAYFKTPENKTDSALVYLDSALSLSKKNNYFEGMTEAMREKGYIFSERGEYVMATQILIEALKLDDKNNNINGSASDLNLIGLVYHQQEKLDEALKYFIKSRNKFTEIKDEGGVAMTNGNMGMVYRSSNKFELALKCYFTAREYYLKVKNEVNVANLENNIGNVYKDFKKYDKALEYFFKAKEGKTKNKMFFSLISTLSNIGDVYVEKKNFNEALNYYNEALAIAKKQNSLRLQKDVYFDMSNLYKQQGDYKLAYESYKQSTQLKDSIITEKYNNQITEMNVKYDSEKKDHDNKLLTKENELKTTKIANERKQKILFALLSLLILLVGAFIYIQYRTKQKLNKQLAQINEKIRNQNNTLKILNKELIDSEENLTISNSTKDQLISMLSHDLYNPITSVTLYTNIALETIEQQTKEDLQKSLLNISNAIVPLQDLLDNILQWAKLQKNNLQSNFENVNINTVITDIIKLYQPIATFKQIKITSNNLQNDIIYTDRLMIYFILRNIVNNAVKFSPKEKEINIETNITKNISTILIKDTGNGFKPEILVQLNNNTNFELKGASGSGIGTSVSRKFIALLNGTIEFRNGENGGAEILISLRQG